MLFIQVVAWCSFHLQLLLTFVVTDVIVLFVLSKLFLICDCCFHCWLLMLLSLFVVVVVVILIFRVVVVLSLLLAVVVLIVGGCCQYCDCHCCC